MARAAGAADEAETIASAIAAFAVTAVFGAARAAALARIRERQRSAAALREGRQRSAHRLPARLPGVLVRVEEPDRRVQPRPHRGRARHARLQPVVEAGGVCPRTRCRTSSRTSARSRAELMKSTGGRSSRSSPTTGAASSRGCSRRCIRRCSTSWSSSTRRIRRSSAKLLREDAAQQKASALHADVPIAGGRSERCQPTRTHALTAAVLGDGIKDGTVTRGRQGTRTSRRGRSPGALTGGLNLPARPRGVAADAATVGGDGSRTRRPRRCSRRRSSSACRRS